MTFTAVASWLTLLRMLGNVAIDGLVGAIPILGDVFDIVWQANVRNLALLHAQRQELGQRPRSQRQVLWLIALALVLTFLGLALLSFLVLRLLYRMLTTV